MRGNAVLLSLLLSSNLFASEDPFSGIYGGICLGAMTSNVSFSNFINYAVPATVNSVDNNFSRSANSILSGGVTLGYSLFMKPQILTGLEVRGNFQTLNIVSNARSVEPISVFYSNTNHAIKMPLDYSLLGKIGFLSSKHMLLYGLAGVNLGHATVSVLSDTSVANVRGAITLSQSSYETGVLAGLGMEYLFSPCASIGFEYNYIDYGYLNYPVNQSTTALANGYPSAGSVYADNNTFKMKVNRGSLRLNYYF